MSAPIDILNPLNRVLKTFNDYGASKINRTHHRKG